MPINEKQQTAEALDVVIVTRTPPRRRLSARHRRNPETLTPDFFAVIRNTRAAATLCVLPSPYKRKSQAKQHGRTWIERYSAANEERRAAMITPAAELATA